MLYKSGQHKVKAKTEQHSLEMILANSVTHFSFVCIAFLLPSGE
jgi:hypothetical protein